MLSFDKRESARKKRFLSARNTAQQLKDILVYRYQARRVVLIGSLTDQQRFDLHSDIDIAVEGLKGESYFSALGELLENADEFEVDLVPIEQATARMRDKISIGEVLYE